MNMLTERDEGGEQPLIVQQRSKRGSNKRMVLMAIAIVVAIMVITAAVFLIIQREDKDDHKTVTMNYREFEEDRDPISFSYRSVNPGDTLLIKDRVVQSASEYDDAEEPLVTYFWSKSAHTGESTADWYDEINGWVNYDLVFKGNLTFKYRAGDNIVITLHCTSFQVLGMTFEDFDEKLDDPLSEALPESSIKKL